VSSSIFKLFKILRAARTVHWQAYNLNVTITRTNNIYTLLFTRLFTSCWRECFLIWKFIANRITTTLPLPSFFYYSTSMYFGSSFACFSVLFQFVYKFFVIFCWLISRQIRSYTLVNRSSTFKFFARCSTSLAPFQGLQPNSEWSYFFVFFLDQHSFTNSWYFFNVSHRINFQPFI